jgi:hypothetical protein
LWSVSKALGVPLDPNVKHLSQLPYTISFVIRKMQQIDALLELPKEKRPPDKILWDGTSEDMDEWLEKVLGNKESSEVNILIKDIEG